MIRTLSMASRVGRRMPTWWMYLTKKYKVSDGLASIGLDGALGNQLVINTMDVTRLAGYE